VTDQPGGDVIDPPDNEDAVDTDIDETEVSEPERSTKAHELAQEHHDISPPQSDAEVDDPNTLMDAAKTFKAPALEAAELERASAKGGGCPTTDSVDSSTVPSGTQEAICIREATSSEAERVSAVATTAASGLNLKSEGAPVRAGSVSNIPGWCITSIRGWHKRRYEACAMRPLVVVMYYYDRMGVHVRGSISFAEFRYLRLSRISGTWESHTTLSMGDAKGNTEGIQAHNASFSCSNSCKAHWRQSFQPFGRDTSVASWSSWVEARAAAGKRHSMTARMTYGFTKYNTAPSGHITAQSNTVRCDRALKGSPTIGCVIPSYTPVMVYKKSGNYPQLARHIEAAQKSKLPGAYRGGKALTRLTDDYKIGRNRSRSCSKSIKKKYKTAGKSCDEYPFASTYQGPYTANITNPRTFTWCKMGRDSDTGPNGFSRCMIHAGQNSSGGSALGTFYSAHAGGSRVLSHDAFKVWIVA
jgi:hypothetical protein